MSLLLSLYLDDGLLCKWIEYQLKLPVMTLFHFYEIFSRFFICLLLLVLSYFSVPIFTCTYIH